MSDNDLQAWYNLVMGGSPPKPEPIAPPPPDNRPFWNKWLDPVRNYQANREMAEVGKRLVKAIETSAEAAKQGTVVNPAFDSLDFYNSNGGSVKEPTGITMGLLRSFAHYCPPLTAIIETWVRYATAFCDTPDKRSGVVKRPGFEIRLTDKNMALSEEDKQIIKELTRFLIEGGFADPPEEEQPINYQPGLQNFAKGFIRDSLTLDGAAIRRWSSVGGRYPLVAFCAEDAARIRKPKRTYLGLDNGVREYEDWDKVNEVANRQGRKIAYLKVDSGNVGGRIVETYTKEQLAYLIRNPRTDTEANGYGYSENERCIDLVTGWCNGLSYNTSRFNNDALPRGVLMLLGQLDETQVQSFKMRWRQMLEGNATKRWRTPILRGQANGGGSVQWVPIDPSSRDMEYNQFMFTLAVIIHSIFGCSPDETGMQNVSPFRPPLSEASPEVKMQNANDKGFDPLLRWFRDVLNRQILWVMFPSRRYSLEFVGVGQGDEMADIQLRGAKLQFGLTTPRQQMNEMDEPIPEHLEEDPAMDMLGPWPANHALLMQMQQSELGMKQQQMAMSQQQEAHQQQMAMQQIQTTQPDMQGAPGQDGGAPGSVPPDPGQGQGPPQLPPGVSPEMMQAGAAMQKALVNPWDDEQVYRVETSAYRRKRKRRNPAFELSKSIRNERITLIGSVPERKR